MCGIAGILELQGRPVNREAVERMVQAQRHRGPDDQGVFVEGAVGLGVCRLAVIDLTPAGRQPLTNENGSIHLVCNGEIYNYLDLRRMLLQKGHRFRSQTDVEVILHLYEEEGERCVESLRGMFAFALWDRRTQRLVLARDRMGQKPLVYALAGDRLIFASEVKAIIASREVSVSVDPVAVDLTFTYGCTPWPHTMFRELRKLPPATVMVVEGSAVRQRRYWAPQFLPKRRENVDELSDELMSLLREATRLQRMSDVPTGVLLSGGIDSTTMATLFAELGTRLRTFTVGFAGQSDTDLQSARLISERIGSRHEEVLVDEQMIHRLPDAIRHYEEPYANPVLLLHFELARQMKRSVTVAHSADGADEVFGGYSGYINWRWFERAHQTVRSLRAAPLLKQVARRLGGADGLGRYAELLTLPLDRVRGANVALRTRPARRVFSRMFHDEVQTSTAQQLLEEFYQKSSKGSFLDRILMMDLLLHDAHSVTALSDTMGMAHAVEIRSIFLDHHVVDVVASVPLRLKVRGLARKVLLRHAVKHLIPREVLARRKVGYGETIPFQYLLTTRWADYARSILLGERLRQSGWFERAEIERLWKEQMCNQANHFNLLWSLLSFGVWLEAFDQHGACVCGTPRVMGPPSKFEEPREQANGHEAPFPGWVKTSTGVELMTEVDPGWWNGLLELCPWATVYQTTYWANHYAAYLGAKPWYLLVRRQGRPVGQLLMLEMLRGHESLMSGVESRLAPIVAPLLKIFTWREGPIVHGQAEESRVLRACLDAVHRLRQERGATGLPEIWLPIGRPDRRSEINAFLRDGYRVELRATYLIDLQVPLDDLWAHFEKGVTRTPIRKAQKQGLTLRKAESLEDVRKFYGLVAAWRRANRFPHYVFDRYRTMFTHMGPACSFFLAERQREVVGAIGLWHFNRRAQLFTPVISEAARRNKIYAGDFMFWEAIRWCHAQGMTNFDLSGVSVRPSDAKEAGIRKFKAKWGGSLVTYPVFHRVTEAAQWRLGSALRSTRRMVRMLKG